MLRIGQKKRCVVRGRTEGLLQSFCDRPLVFVGVVVWAKAIEQNEIFVQFRVQLLRFAKT